MPATLNLMSNKKKPHGDRHKPRRMVGIPERVAAALEEVAKEREASLAEIVKYACLFFLEDLKRWPPTAGKSPPKS